MKEKEALQILTQTNALLSGHFVLTSGRHASGYINKDAIYPHIWAVKILCEEIASRLPGNIEVVAAPAIGGVILSQWVSYDLNQRLSITLNQRQEVLSVYAEKDITGNLVFRRGYDKPIKEGTKVAVVEDVLTTGGSVKKVVEAVRNLGGHVLAVGAICNRGGTAEDIGSVPCLFSLTNFNLQSWTQDECQLCAKGVPVNTDVGKGAEFLARKS